jgi:hypothetical protein
VPGAESLPQAVVPRASTVDEIMAELEAVQTQKADLEKRERDLKAKLQVRLKELEDRLKKMGVVLPAPPPPQPDVKDNVDVKSPPPRDLDSRDKEKK